MKNLIINKISIKKLLIIGFLIVMVIIAVIMSNGTQISYAASLTNQDYSSGIWFNAENYNRNSGWTYKSGNREQWDNNEQAERMEYFLYKTNKRPELKALSSIRAYHVQGQETVLQIGVSQLTQEETVHSLGPEVEAKVGIVIGKIGAGFKWGNALSRAISSKSIFTCYTTTSSGFYTRAGQVELQQYYLLVRKVTRVVNKDKNGNITYGTYSAQIDYNLSGYFEMFNLENGVNYQTIRG